MLTVGSLSIRRTPLGLTSPMSDSAVSPHDNQSRASEGGMGIVCLHDNENNHFPRWMCISIQHVATIE